MTRRFILAGALAAMSYTASAVAPQTGEEALAGVLKDRTAGKPVECIALRRVRDSHIVDGTAILFNVGGVLYVNKPASGGQSLSKSKAMLIRLHSSELCRGQTIQLLDAGANMPSGFEQLGEFIPYRESRPERAMPNIENTQRRGPSGY